MKDETEFPSSKANKEEWEKLNEPSPWLEHAAVKLSPIVFGCGLLGYGFKYGYNKQIDNFKKEEKALQQRILRKRKGVGSNSKLVDRKRLNFNKYDPKVNIEDRARKLALKALGYSTVLTAAFFLGGFATVGICLNVTSIRNTMSHCQKIPYSTTKRMKLDRMCYSNLKKKENRQKIIVNFTYM